MSGDENRHQDGPAGGGDVIAVGMLHLLNQPMGTQESQFAADHSGLPSTLFGGLSLAGKQKFL